MMIETFVNRSCRHTQSVAFALMLMTFAPIAAAAPFAYVPNTGTNNVTVLNTAVNAVATTISVGSSPFGVAVSPDGSRVYVSNELGNTVSVIDTATNTVIATIAVGSSPLGVAVSPDGKRVYVANGASSGTVSVIDTTTNTVVATVPVGSRPYGVAVSPNSGRVYVANSSSNSVSVIDAVTDKVVATITAGSLPYGIAVSPDGSRLYVANAFGGTVSVINTATKKAVSSITVNSPYGIAVSPDGTRVYAANEASNNVSVIDTATNKVVATIAVGTGPGGVAISPDGSRLYVANTTSNDISVIDTSTDAVVSTVTAGNAPSSLGAFVGPGALIAFNSNASGNAGVQLSGTVPALGNSTSCTPTDSIVGNAVHGSVTLDASTGAFTYTPASGSYSGPDAFTWRGVAPSGCTAADAPTSPQSNVATVSLTLMPTLTGLSDATVPVDSTSRETFSIAGSTPFRHTLASSNATVLPPTWIALSPADCGLDPSRLYCNLYFMVSPVPGTTTITLSMKDRFGQTVTRTIHVTTKANLGSSGGGGTSSPYDLLLLAMLLALGGWRRHALRAATRR